MHNVILKCGSGTQHPISRKSRFTSEAIPTQRSALPENSAACSLASASASRMGEAKRPIPGRRTRLGQGRRQRRRRERLQPKPGRSGASPVRHRAVGRWPGVLPSWPRRRSRDRSHPWSGTTPRAAPAHALGRPAARRRRLSPLPHSPAGAGDGDPKSL
jgi:hypothetical protein